MGKVEISVEMGKVEISVEMAKRLIAGNASKGASAHQLVDAWNAMEELEEILKNRSNPDAPA